MTRRRRAGTTGALAGCLVVLLLCLSSCQAPRIQTQVGDPDIPESEPVRAAAAEAAPELDALLGAVVADREPFVTAHMDVCTQGERNWKYEDSHQWNCGWSTEAGVAGGDDVEQGLREQDELVLAAGCKPRVFDDGNVRDIDYFIATYWDRLSGDERVARELPPMEYECGSTELNVIPTDPGYRTETNSFQIPECPDDASGLKPHTRTMECDRPDRDGYQKVFQDQQDSLLLYLQVRRSYAAPGW
ncbi:hypothetical protein ACQBAR_09330 [Propionibacteriaceae bacterium Y1685]|uniref:hypothetical protein n=1 Tax=Microlunatus sp. Y1700 TaxID=3418487 RepID=UPI003B791970